MNMRCNSKFQIRPVNRQFIPLCTRITLCELMGPLLIGVSYVLLRANVMRKANVSFVVVVLVFRLVGFLLVLLLLIFSFLFACLLVWNENIL